MAIETTSIQASATNLADNVTLEATGAQLQIKDNGVSGDKIAMGSDAQGDILYYNGTNYTRLGAGTSGQVLQTNGAGQNPSWATAGNYSFITSSTASGSTDNIDISSLTLTAYKKIRIIAKLKDQSGGTTTVSLKINNDSGAGQYAYVYVKNGTAVTSASSTNIVLGEINSTSFTYIDVTLDLSTGSKRNLTGSALLDTSFYSCGGQWVDTSTAITRFAVGLSGVNLDTGSYMQIWGIS